MSKNTINSMPGSKDDLNAAHTTLSAEKVKKPKKKELAAGNSSRNPSPNQNYDPNRIKSKTIISPIPNVEPRAEKYSPMPYIFRLPSVATSSQGNVKNQSVRCPPFHILLDHSISVIWSLYSKEEYGKPLGINQLQWALQFIMNIRDSEGKNPRDVTHCINTISDVLIDLYADLIDELKKSKKRSSSHKPQATSSGTEVTPAGPSPSDAGLDEENEVNEEPRADENSDLMFQTNDVPFSINYAEMISRAPEAITDVDEAILNASQNLDKDGMVKFLCEWKKDQMEKLFAELERLTSIENYLGTVTKSVEPYICPEDREMLALLAEKVRRKTDRNTEV